MRRFLTEEFVSKVQPPEKGEHWIADTGVRGFGLRLWAPNGKAFAIRTKDKDGKSVRRTFDPHSQSSYSNLYRWRRLKGLGASDLDQSSFLELAREWAREELDEQRKINSYQTSFEEAELEHAAMRRRVGNYLRAKQLGELVEQVLSSGHARGWSLEYSDRLRSAFNAFDPDNDIRCLHLEQLKDGKLASHYNATPLGTGNTRMVRLLLNVVAENVSALGGVSMSQAFDFDNLSKPYWHRNYETLSIAPPDDFERLYRTLKHADLNWQSILAIEMCLLTPAPISQILAGKWSNIRDGKWYPESSKILRRLGLRVKKSQERVLKTAITEAKRQGINSEYWFPSPHNPESPIRNIDRAWRRILQQSDWPKVSLAEMAIAFQGKCPELVWSEN